MNPEDPMRFMARLEREFENMQPKPKENIPGNEDRGIGVAIGLGMVVSGAVLDAIGVSMGSVGHESVWNDLMTVAGAGTSITGFMLEGGGFLAVVATSVSDLKLRKPKN